jgi:predicted chitinase
MVPPGRRIRQTFRRTRRSRYPLPTFDWLEARELLTGSVLLSPVTQIQSFAGVGFALNPVATAEGSLNNQSDSTPGDYQAQVDWGDGSGFTSQGVKIAMDGSSVVIKDSHTYETAETYQAQTTSVVVTNLPDAASRPPSAPTTYTGAKAVGVVGLAVSPETQIQSFAGVGFALNPVASVAGTYNFLEDNTPGDYHAQINWGDGPSWGTKVGLAVDGNAILIKGSHIYSQAGTYAVTVYVTGPDGQTASLTSTSVVVTLMPDAASRPADALMSSDGAEPVGVVGLAHSGATEISARTGVEIDGAPIAAVGGTYDGATDASVGDYQVQVNWGDSPQWVGGTELSSASSHTILFYGSHTYATAGTYDVTVYVAGPDGQTTSATVTAVVVTQSPTPPPGSNPSPPVSPSPTPPTAPAPPSPPTAASPLAISVSQIQQIVTPPQGPSAPTAPGPDASASAKKTYAKKLARYQKAETKYEQTLKNFNFGVSVLVGYLNSQHAQQTEQINTTKRQAAFIGQVAAETQDLTLLTEGPSSYQSSKSKYKGRGLLQLTGKGNYKSASADLGLGTLLVDNPNLVASNPTYAGETAGWYWNSANLNAQADVWDISRLSALVNRGPDAAPGAVALNLSGRLAYSNAALQVLQAAR